MLDSNCHLIFQPKKFYGGFSQSPQVFGLAIRLPAQELVAGTLGEHEDWVSITSRLDLQSEELSFLLPRRNKKFPG